MDMGVTVGRLKGWVEQMSLGWTNVESVVEHRAFGGERKNEIEFVAKGAENVLYGRAVIG